MSANYHTVHVVLSTAALGSPDSCYSRREPLCYHEASRGVANHGRLSVSMTFTPHISVHGLTKVFHTRQGSLTALEGVDLEVEEGAFISIIGPSGGGKTTLLKAIGGLLEPTCGTILVDGLPPAEAQRRKSIGFVFQEPALLPWRTVEENIRLPLQLNARETEVETGDPAHLLEAVGLKDFRDYYPRHLSGGMKQRVALARALVPGPGSAPDGRAARRSGRDDTHRDALRAPAALGVVAEDRRLSNPQHP